MNSSRRARLGWERHGMLGKDEVKGNCTMVVPAADPSRRAEGPFS